MEPTFDAAAYVADLRRFVPLETLSTELEGHLTTLKNRVCRLRPSWRPLRTHHDWSPYNTVEIKHDAALQTGCPACVPDQTRTINERRLSSV